MYQPTLRKPFQRYSAALNGRNVSSSTGRRVWRPVRKEFRDAVRNMEVTCLNQVFQGIGFRNDNGGLEFYSEGLRSYLAPMIREELDSLHNQLVSMESEFETVSSEVLRGRLHIQEWQSFRSRKEKELSHISAEISRLATLSRNGEIPEGKTNSLRAKLGGDRNRIKNQLDNCIKEIDAYNSNLNRQKILDLCLEELRHHIKDKERELSASNTFTLEQSGLLTFPFIKGIRSKSCCLFADIADYIAFVRFSGETSNGQYPKCCDGIVLNDPRNFYSLLSEIENSSYESFYCFFPNTVLGKTMEKTIISREEGRAVSMEKLFDGYVSLHEHETELADNHLNKDKQ